METDHLQAIRTYFQRGATIRKQIRSQATSDAMPYLYLDTLDIQLPQFEMSQQSKPPKSRKTPTMCRQAS